jgi:hypothetical protein
MNRQRSVPGLPAWQQPGAAAAVGLLLLGTVLGAGLLWLGVTIGAGLASKSGSPAAGASPTTRVSATSPTTPAKPGASLPPAFLPSPSGQANSAIGNYDGTAEKETFTAVPVTDKSGKTVDWTLLVNGPTGPVHSATLSSLVGPRAGCPALDNIEYARVLGSGNLGPPTRDFALVEVARGASTQFAIMVAVDHDGLGLVTVTSGAERCQRVFPFNGSVTHGNGFTCGWSDNVPVLWVLQVDVLPSDSTHYDWYRATYAWQGLNLSLQSLDHAVITNGDDRFGPAYQARCSSFTLP